MPTTLLLYLVPVVLTATRWGRGPAIIAVLLSVLGHDVLFVEPMGTLTVADSEELVGLVLLLFTALVTAGEAGILGSRPGRRGRYPRPAAHRHAQMPENGL